MPSRKTLLANELKRKADMLTEEILEFANGSHTLYTHVGLSDEDLMKRCERTKKDRVSSFFSRELILECLRDYIHDEMGSEDLVNWLQDPCGRHICEGCIFLEDDDVKKLGRVCYSDGTIVDGYGYTLVLESRGTGYYNRITNLPFDVVTVYVEE